MNKSDTIASAATGNVADALPAMADSQPYTLAVVVAAGRDRRGRVRYTHFTYRQLDDESDRIARGLRESGVGRGVHTVLMVTPGLDFFALTFAIFKVGAVPVLVDSGMGVRNLGKCLAEAEPETFIGIPRAHLARRLLGWARPTLRTTVVVDGGRIWAGLGALTLEDVRRRGDAATGRVLEATSTDDTAAILFTSGSTGVPKGVVYTHGTFLAQVESIRTIYGIEAGEIDLPTFPLFALFAPALGTTAVIADMDVTRPARVDPRKIIEAIEDFGVTTMFGSPALIDRVGRHGARHGIRLPTLRRVLSAGAPVSASILERFAAMLPDGVEIFTPYGATESLPVCSQGSAEILAETRLATDAGAGVCVGRPVAGIDLRIIRITDEPIESWSEDLVVAAGEVGEICVRGPVVTRRYFNRERSSALAKIIDAVDGGFWHRMGDLGYLDDRGRVWFCGRKAQRVETGRGGTDPGLLFTVPCESVFNTHPDVLRTALVGVERGGATVPVLCVELERASRGVDRRRVEDELLAIGANNPKTATIRTILFHDAFPVDIRHNAKIFREKLAVWAAGRRR